MGFLFFPVISMGFRLVALRAARAPLLILKCQSPGNVVIAKFDDIWFCNFKSVMFALLRGSYINMAGTAPIAQLFYNWFWWWRKESVNNFKVARLTNTILVDSWGFSGNDHWGCMCYPSQSLITSRNSRQNGFQVCYLERQKNVFLAVDNATVPTNPVSVLSPKASKSSHCKRKPYDDVSPGRSRSQDFTE